MPEEVSGLPAWATCPDCGGRKHFDAKRCRACRNGLVGRHTSGYVLVRPPSGGKKVYAHRLVAETALGRPLRTDEQVHHINGDKTDNRPENLEVLSVKEHRERHAPAECLRGHPLVPENVYIRPDTGGRQCRTCNHLRSAAVAARRKEARHARGLLRKRAA